MPLGHREHVRPETNFPGFHTPETSLTGTGYIEVDDTPVGAEASNPDGIGFGRPDQRNNRGSNAGASLRGGSMDNRNTAVFAPTADAGADATDYFGFDV